MRYINRRFLYLFLFFSLISFSPAGSLLTFAQSEAGQNITSSYWVQAGPAITTLGLGYNGAVSAQIGNHYFSLKTTSTEISYWDETWDVSFIYGRHTQINSFSFYAGTGLAALGGTSYTSLLETTAHEDFGPVIGFPVEGTVYWHPISFVGVGFNVFANINTEQPFGGFGLVIRGGYFNLSN